MIKVHRLTVCPAERLKQLVTSNTDHRHLVVSASRPEIAGTVAPPWLRNQQSKASDKMTEQTNDVALGSRSRSVGIPSRSRRCPKSSPSVQCSLFAREGLVDCPAWPSVRTRGYRRARKVARRRRECCRQQLRSYDEHYSLSIEPVVILQFVCRADPFSKKDWYEVKAPNSFTSRSVGKTLVTRTQGTKVSIQSHHLFWAAADLISSSARSAAMMSTS